MTQEIGLGVLCCKLANVKLGPCPCLNYVVSNARSSGLHSSKFCRRFYARQLWSELYILSSISVEQLPSSRLLLPYFCSILRSRNNSSFPMILPSMPQRSQTSDASSNLAAPATISRSINSSHTANTAAYPIDLIRLELFPHARNGRLFQTTIVPFSTLSRFAWPISFRARHTNGRSPS